MLEQSKGFKKKFYFERNERHESGHRIIIFLFTKDEISQCLKDKSSE